DDPAGAEDRPRARARDAEGAPLPQHRAVLVDDARRVDHRADREIAAQCTGDAERDEALTVRNAVRDPEADAHGRPETPREALLDRHRAGEDQPVRVHAMLLAPSLRDDAAS